MTYAAIARVVLAMVVGVGLLAAILIAVPGPVQVLALLIGLPLEAMLLALATSGDRPRITVRQR
ncbi:MAG TPA: hypothetical protein VIL01_11305 [Thermomicrobiales bacterium]